MVKKKVEGQPTESGVTPITPDPSISQEPGTPAPETPQAVEPPAPPSSGVPVDTPEAAAAFSMENSPEPNEAAIQATLSGKPGGNPPGNPAGTPGKPTGNPPGTPTKPQDGKNKGGRPSSSAKEAQAKAQELVTKEKCRRAGYGSADSMLLIFRMAFGPEWAPDPPSPLIDPSTGKQAIHPVTKLPMMRDERMELREGWADTYEAYGWHETPKWFPMVASTVGFAWARVSRPQTASKLQKAKEAAAAWWAKRKVKAGG